MKKLICIAALIAVTMISCFGFVYAEEETPKKHDTASVLAEASTVTVICSENPDLKMPHGSLCKLMTILLVAEEITEGKLLLNESLTASTNANSQQGAVIWLMQGESISVDELLKAVIIGNANDAAVVLAEHIGGSDEEFINMMNARAFELGMRNTVYKSCTGLDTPGQYSTAYDTALLASELLKHEFLQKYFNTWMDNVRDGQTELVNENKLVRTYDGITGMKAGRSAESGFSLVLTAKRGEAAFISVVMGCEDKDERFNIGKSLMATGFSGYKVTTPAFSDEFLRPVAVRGGKQSAVMLKAENLKELVVPKSIGEMSTAVLIPEYIDAPVKKGQVAGRVGFYNGETLLFETNLVTCEDIEKNDFANAIRKMLVIIYK